MSKEKIEFKLDYKGFGEILKGDEMMAVLMNYARGVQARAGEGYTVEPFHGFDREKAYIVRASSKRARQDNFDNNTLEKAVRR